MSNSSLKCYVIAGEVSGDLHASRVMRAMRDRYPSVAFRFWGGDRMEAVGGKAVKHIQDLSFMGFVEVVLHLRTIVKNMRWCKRDLLDYRPDILLLVDYPGFNLRIAQFAKAQGIPVHYYISPQLWAWKKRRGWKIKAAVDQLYCILPFEPAFYRKHFGMEVEYVGHPLLEAIHHFKATALSESDFKRTFQLDDRPVMALLPGSRRQEINLQLPVMLEAAKHYPDHQVIIAGTSNVPMSTYDRIVGGYAAQLSIDRTYDILHHAALAMVTSGTATLETALFRVPQIVCYKGHFISYQIAKRLVKVPYISLVNLIMDKLVVKELIQGDLTPEALRSEVDRLLQDETYRRAIERDYEQLTHALGKREASESVADQVLQRWLRARHKHSS